MKSVINASKIANKDSKNYEARSNIMWSATWALNTDKQIEAMKIVNIKYKEYTIYEIIKSFVYHFLKEYEK